MTIFQGSFKSLISNHRGETHGDNINTKIDNKMIRCGHWD